MVEENQQLADRLSKLEYNQEASIRILKWKIMIMSNIQVVSAQAKAKISLLHTTTVTLWKKRNRMATDLEYILIQMIYFCPQCTVCNHIKVTNQEPT